MSVRRAALSNTPFPELKGEDEHYYFFARMSAAPERPQTPPRLARAYNGKLRRLDGELALYSREVARLRHEHRSRARELRLSTA